MFVHAREDNWTPGASTTNILPQHTLSGAYLMRPDLLAGEGMADAPHTYRQEQPHDNIITLFNKT